MELAGEIGQLVVRASADGEKSITNVPLKSLPSWRSSIAPCRRKSVLKGVLSSAGVLAQTLLKHLLFIRQQIPMSVLLAPRAAAAHMNPVLISRFCARP